MYVVKNSKKLYRSMGLVVKALNESRRLDLCVVVFAHVKEVKPKLYTLNDKCLSLFPSFQTVWYNMSL